MWPCEEVLALYLTLESEVKKEILSCTTAIELGAGKSGLVGFQLSKMGLLVMITDGNVECAKTLLQVK